MDIVTRFRRSNNSYKSEKEIIGPEKKVKLKLAYIQDRLNYFDFNPHIENRFETYTYAQKFQANHEKL